MCSVTPEMFEHRNSGENRRKRSEFFFDNLRRAYKDLIQVKKKIKIISCLCTFKESIESMAGVLKSLKIRPQAFSPFTHVCTQKNPRREG